MHFASPRDLFLAHHRDVVLGLAGDGAGAATNAGVKIDDHPPRLAGVVDLRIKGLIVPWRWVIASRDVVRSVLKIAKCSEADLIATFHFPMLLSGDDLVSFARPFNF